MEKGNKLLSWLFKYDNISSSSKTVYWLYLLSRIAIPLVFFICLIIPIWSPAFVFVKCWFVLVVVFGFIETRMGIEKIAKFLYGKDVVINPAYKKKFQEVLNAFWVGIFCCIIPIIGNYFTNKDDQMILLIVAIVLISIVILYNSGKSMIISGKQ